MYFQETKREIADRMFAGRQVEAALLARDRLTMIDEGSPTPRQVAYRGTTSKPFWRYRGRSCV